MDEVHLANLEQITARERHEPACAFESGAAALRAIVFNHYLLKIFIHASVRRSLLAILAVRMLQLIHDSVKFYFFADVLMPEFRPRRQSDFELLPLGAVEEHLDVSLGQILERCVEAESVMCGEAVEERLRDPACGRELAHPVTIGARARL